MLKRIKRFFILLAIIIIVLSSLPFLTKRRVDDEALNEQVNRFLERNNKEVPVKLIESADEALTSRLALIEQATDTINLCYYRIQGTDETAQHVLSALMNAAQRGVSVTIVVDSKFGGLDKHMIKILNSEENINVYLYNPINIMKPESLQVSLHNKFMMVDDKFVITGGRNISDTFLKEVGTIPNTSFDLDVLIKNNNDKSNITQEFSELLDHILDPSYTARQHAKPNNSSLIEKNNMLRSYDQYKIDSLFDADTMIQTINESLFIAEDVKIVHTSLQPIKKDPLIGRIMYDIATKSYGDVYIQSPYLIGDDMIINALQDIANNKQVHLLTNSLASSPNYPAFSNYLFHRKKFVNLDVTVYEYMSDGSSSVHTKAYVLGDKLTAIGSMNLDNRSLFINSEQMLIIESDTMHDKLLCSMSKQVDESNSVPHNLKQYKQAYEKNTPLIKKILMKLCAIILRPFQSFL